MPLIIEPRSDLRTIASKVAVAGFSHAGQSCISTQRILVERSVHDGFVVLLEAEVANLIVGDPLSSETDVGPLITDAAAVRVESWIDDARSAGASVVTGGTRCGAVVAPTVLTNVPLDSKVWREELFGPAVAVVSYKNFEDALDLANDTDLALQVGVWTPDIGRALSAVRRLDVGGVLINEVPTYRADQQPYGGAKGSGNTREGPAYAIREMSREKFVMLTG